MINAILSSPFFGIVLTLVTYAIGIYLQKKTTFILANPIIVSMFLIICTLVIFKIPVSQYDSGASTITLFLAPATAVLGVNIYNQIKILKKYFIPILVGSIVGSTTSVLGVLAICKLLSVNEQITNSLFAKSVTTAIAIGITDSRGGILPITIVTLMLTGIIGGILGPTMCKIFKIKHPVAQGLALGTSTHAIGTTKALTMGEIQGAVSGIAIGACGICTVILSAFL